MSILNNFNYIKDLQYFPCAEPAPLIIIETGLAAGALAMLEFASWGCRDFLKARIGRAQPCGRFMKAALSADPKGAAFIDKANKLYGFLGPVDKALYAWLVADIASTFLARWLSFAYAATGCIPSEFDNHYNYVLAAPFTLDEGQQAIIPWRLAEGSFPGPGSGMDAPPHWYFSIYFQITCRPLFTSGTANFDTFIHEHAGIGGFDLPHNNNAGWHPNKSLTGHGKLYAHNEKNVVTRYIPMIEANELLICTGGKASVTVSPLPILGSYLQPLSCFQHDLGKYFPDIEGFG